MLEISYTKILNRKIFVNLLMLFEVLNFSILHFAHIAKQHWYREKHNQCCRRKKINYV